MQLGLKTRYYDRKRILKLAPDDPQPFEPLDADLQVGDVAGKCRCAASPYRDHLPLLMRLSRAIGTLVKPARARSFSLDRRPAASAYHMGLLRAARSSEVKGAQFDALFIRLLSPKIERLTTQDDDLLNFAKRGRTSEKAKVV